MESFRNGLQGLDRMAGNRVYCPGAPAMGQGAQGTGLPAIYDMTSVREGKENGKEEEATARGFPVNYQVMNSR